jgi:hypothetical protein
VCFFFQMTYYIVVSAGAITRPDSVGFIGTNLLVKFLYGEKIMVRFEFQCGMENYIYSSRYDYIFLLESSLCSLSFSLSLSFSRVYGSVL